MTTSVYIEVKMHRLEFGREIEGAGNTSTQMTYKWIDNNPMSGTNYYRLSQTDYDGTSESFAPIVVTCETGPNRWI